MFKFNVQVQLVTVSSDLVDADAELTCHKTDV